MRSIEKMAHRFRSLFRRDRVERELDAELQFHLDRQIEENLAAGMPPGEARRSALRTIGGIEQFKEECRDMRKVNLVMDFLQDVRYAARTLINHPGFTTVAVLSLALGIGANTAIFSFVDAILYRPLDVPRPRDVVRISTATPAQRFSDLSFREFETFRDRNTTLSGLAAEWRIEVGVQIDENDVSRVTLGCLVNRDYFKVLGVEPTRGRSFLPEEDSPGAREIVTIVSHGAWKNRFNGDPDIIGQNIRLNGQPATVVGVASASFTGTDVYTRHEFYVPLSMAKRMRPASRILDDPADRGLEVRGRLKRGAGMEAVRGDFGVIATALEETYPETNRERTANILVDIDDRLQRKVQDSQLSIMLLGTVALVLLIAAVNVANLLLGRAAARTKEIAIRMSVGAGRFRLVRQLLTESMLLAGLGGAAGLLLANWAIRYLRSIPLPTDYPIVIDVRLDGRVLLYTLLLASITGIVFGLAPALDATRSDLVSPVKGGRSRYRGRYVLVAAQAALSVVLLICAGLFAKNFYRASVINPGYRVDNVLLTSFSPALVNMPKPRIESFYQDIQTRVRALPGVKSVTIARHVNLGPDAFSRKIWVDGYQFPRERQWDWINQNYVDSEFFETMATPIIEGRAIDDRDTSDAPKVAVVNDTMAKRFWPNRSAIGERIKLVDADNQPVEVIGVARDAKYFNALETPKAYFYLPYRQYLQNSMTLHVHTSADPLSLVTALRREVQTLEPELPMFDVRTMRDVFQNKGLLAARLIAQMVGLMGIIGLTLAVVGLYAVMAFLVSCRTREIGIRMALGATRTSVEKMILGTGLKVAVAGLVAGLAVAVAIVRLIASMLTGVSPRDPVVFVSVAATLLSAAVLSSWLPARRAASVDPTITLRHE